MTPKRSDISVLFASPNALTRELVMKALNRHKHFHVVATVTTPQEILKAVQSVHVDVALISATLADGPMSGLGVLRQICECSPKVKSVIFSTALNAIWSWTHFGPAQRASFAFRSLASSHYAGAWSRSTRDRSGEIALNFRR